MPGVYGPGLDRLLPGHTVALLVDSQARLHLHVNGVDQGVAASDIPDQVWAVFDLYGSVDEIMVTTAGEERVGQGAGLEKEKKFGVGQQFPASACSYLATCLKFKHSLGLPDAFFEAGPGRCYCETCWRSRGEEETQVTVTALLQRKSCWA